MASGGRRSSWAASTSGCTGRASLSIAMGGCGISSRKWPPKPIMMMCLRGSTLTCNKRGTAVKLNSKQYSAAGEPLVILHGLYGNQANWAWHARALAEHYAVYAFD